MRLHTVHDFLKKLSDLSLYVLKKLVPPTSGAASHFVSTDVVSTLCGPRRRCWLLHRFPPDSESLDTLQRQNCRLLSKTKLSLATVVEKGGVEWVLRRYLLKRAHRTVSYRYSVPVPRIRRKNRGLKYPFAYQWCGIYDLFKQKFVFSRRNLHIRYNSYTPYKLYLQWPRDNLCTCVYRK